LLFRRIPIVYALHRWIYQIEQKRQALFVGFFGPIGVSAVFYIHVASVYLEGVTAPDGTQREDARQLNEAIEVIVWFMVMCSILVHGTSIPLAKLFLQIPRALSSAPSESRDEGQAFSSDNQASEASEDTELKKRRERKDKSKKKEANKKPNKEEIGMPLAMRKIGHPVANDGPSSDDGDVAEKKSDGSRDLTENDKIELEREGHIAPIRN